MTIILSSHCLKKIKQPWLCSGREQFDLHLGLTAGERSNVHLERYDLHLVEPTVNNMYSIYLLLVNEFY